MFFKYMVQCDPKCTSLVWSVSEKQLSPFPTVFLSTDFIVSPYSIQS